MSIRFSPESNQDHDPRGTSDSHESRHRGHVDLDDYSRKPSFESSALNFNKEREREGKVVLFRRVLLVDDDKILCDSLADALSSQNYDVVRVYTGCDALESLRYNEFDAVVVDFQLPDIDGIEVLRQIKEIDRSIGTLMLSGVANFDDITTSLHEGADTYVLKPVEIEELIRKLENISRKKTGKKKILTLNEDERKIREIVEVFDGVASGEGYLVRSHDRAYEIFTKLYSQGVPGLCISRKNPAKLISDYGIKPENIFLLSTKSLAGYEAISDLQEASRKITNFLADQDRPIIVLDGLEYLVNRFGFDSFLKFVQEKRFDFIESDAILLVPFSPLALSDREMALLNSEMNILSDS